MKSCLILNGMLVIPLGLAGCAAIAGVPAEQPVFVEKVSDEVEPAALQENDVTVQTEVFTFDNCGGRKAVTRYAYTVRGEKAGLPADELMKCLPAAPTSRPAVATPGYRHRVDRRRYETVHHRRITDETKVVSDEPGDPDEVQPGPKSPPPTSQPAGPEAPAKGSARGGCIRWLIRQVAAVVETIV